MKKIILILVVLFLLIGTIPAQADDGIEVIETITTDSTVNGCKTQSHKLSFVSGGVEVAWIKLNGVNACWGVSCVSLQNSTRTKWASTGYSWVLGGAVLGGKACTRNTFEKYSNAELHMPSGYGYLTHQRMTIYFSKPLAYNWYATKTPVFFK